MQDWLHLDKMMDRHRLGQVTLYKSVMKIIIKENFIYSSSIKI